MAHFAKVENGIVTKVVVAEQHFIDSGALGEPSSWIQTSYNTYRGIHFGADKKPDGGVALRGNYAGIGFIYDKENDVFYEPQPFPSWTISGPSWFWKPPVPMPEDGNQYQWDENSLSWVLVIEEENT